MSRTPFPSLHVAGGLLPPDLFGRVLEDNTLPGRQPVEYGLGKNRTVREAASRAFDDLSTEWHSFVRDRDRAEQEGRPLGGLTRDWLRALLRELDFGILAAAPAGGVIVEDKPFKISHIWQHVPIHLLPLGVDLDHRTKGVAGAADAAPQSMVQELLNRADEHLWAIVSNGQKLRLLRDSRSLAGSAYVEFDLELIFTEHLFSDFVLLFRLVHASRFAVEQTEQSNACWLEKWRTTAISQGERALDRLRVGVEQAITSLGTGFLRHPANAELRDRLTAGTLDWDDFKRSILRVVYRLLFWFVAEDRDVLLDPDQELATQRARYMRFFSAHRLRERARRGSADHHEDLWEAVRLVFVALGSEEGEQRLALPGIGGIFERITRDDDDELMAPSIPDELDQPLEGQRLTNETVIAAVRHLAIVDSNGQRRPVDFRNLDSEELGSVYESLLELHPSYDEQEQTFTLTKGAGSERKTTGSYYTPSSLTDALLDSALDPILDEAATSASDREAKVEALLNVTVCDPACGSGHFLVAAARRIARRVAQIRSGEDEPSPDLVRHAMREVVSRCIHGVDINDMAAELAKVSLWLESVEPGKPLPFLDANIRVGNALLGVTPALLDKGIPREAFNAIEGDSKQAAKAIQQDNDAYWDNQGSLFDEDNFELDTVGLGQETTHIVTALPDKLVDTYVQRRRLRQLDKQRAPIKRVADAWCAAFVQEKTQEVFVARTAITQATLDWIGGEPADETQRQTAGRVAKLAEQFRFFHWHVEFPHIFGVPEDGAGADEQTGWRGGFHCVIGNPPWERVKLQEQEFFAFRRPEIAAAKNASVRKKLIAALSTSDSESDKYLYADFQRELHHAEGWSHLLRVSGRYPLTGRGDINTYAVFAETARTVAGQQSRTGMVLPTGIATDTSTADFFGDLVRHSQLVHVYGFRNNMGLFKGVGHGDVRFCLLAFAAEGNSVQAAHFGFDLGLPEEIRAGQIYSLTSSDIQNVNPNTGTCPTFKSPRDARITLAIYRRVPILSRNKPVSNPWNLSYMTMFHMANDSGLFRDQRELEEKGWEASGNAFSLGEDQMIPLYEGKMVHQYDHRFGDYRNRADGRVDFVLPRASDADKSDGSFTVLPRYWVPEKEVEDRLSRKGWIRTWLLGWRDICRNSDARTTIFSVIPRRGVGHTWPIVLSDRHDIALLYGNLCAFVLDYVARQKIAGTHLTYAYLNQLPVLDPAAYECYCSWDVNSRQSNWITDRILELTYTAYDIAAFARDHGDDGPPFRWNEDRRFWLRAELDAAYFHLYGVPADDVGYIMDTFRAFRNNDPDRFARTKKAILDIYDAMAKAIETGEPYQTVLDPPPGHGPRHPARTDSLQ